MLRMLTSRESPPIVKKKMVGKPGKWTSETRRRESRPKRTLILSMILVCDGIIDEFDLNYILARLLFEMNGRLLLP